MAERVFNFIEKTQQNRVLLDRIISEQRNTQFYSDRDIIDNNDGMYELAHLARLKELREVSKSKKDKTFLDIISRPEIYECIQYIICLLLEQLKINTFVKMKKCRFLPNELHPDILEIMNKCVYLKGGTAYKEYDKYLQSIVGYEMNESTFVPRTDDFDIIVAVDTDSEACFMSFYNIMKRMAIQLSMLLLKIGLLEMGNFHRITSKTLPAVIEKFRDTIGKDSNFETLNDILLLSIRKHNEPGKSNWNYRVSLVIEVEGELHLATIIEVIVSNDNEVYNDINMLLLGNSPSFISKQIAMVNLPTSLLKLAEIKRHYGKDMLTAEYKETYDMLIARMEQENHDYRTKLLYGYENGIMTLPDIESLIKLSLKSLVNRGVISHRTEAYDKCVKDFSRLGYLFTVLLNPIIEPEVYTFIGSTIENIRVLHQLFKYINDIINFCSNIYIGLEIKSIIENLHIMISMVNNNNELHRIDNLIKVELAKLSIYSLYNNTIDRVKNVYNNMIAAKRQELIMGVYNPENAKIFSEFETAMKARKQDEIRLIEAERDGRITALTIDNILAGL